MFEFLLMLMTIFVAASGTSINDHGTAEQNAACGLVQGTSRLMHGHNDGKDYISSQQFPWLVRFNVKHSLGDFCSGALVAKSWVLTSASCARIMSANRNADVKIGYIDPEDHSVTDNSARLSGKIIYHPEYKASSNPEESWYLNRHPVAYDFALLKLEHSYTVGGANIICLPSLGNGDNGNETLDHTDCQLVGYGRTLTRRPSDENQQHARPVQSVRMIGECDEAFPGQNNRTDALCVDADAPKDDYHYFLPGSIMQCKSSDNRLVLQGLGWDLFYPEMPMGNIRKITDWIRHTVEEGKECGASRDQPLPDWISFPPNFLAPDNYPWMVLIVNEMGMPVCNGILISDTHVLTSKRCVNTLPRGGYRKIRLVAGIYDGEYPLVKTERQTPLIHVTRTFASDSGYRHVFNKNQIPVKDFLVIQVNGSFHDNANVSPICLPNEGDNFPHHENPQACKVIGFGGIEERFEFHGQFYLTQKNVTEIKAIEQCPKYEYRFRDDEPYCLDLDLTGDLFNHYFHPGAAFTCLDDNGKWKLWGITAIRNYPGIGVSNILKGLSFIKRTIQE